MKTGEIKHKNLRLITVKNETMLSDCKLCCLERPKCDDICLLAGHSVYIGAVIKLKWYQQVYSFIYRRYIHIMLKLKFIFHRVRNNI